MIQFSKLRIHGFKSFVDRTELEIAPGLNGIVGPNGCGKSNLVEALRWVMGESSAKRMRGGSGGMEDVIFNGTEKRAKRNLAEVSVLLDNTSRSAPAQFNNTDEIEVTRKIERDHGSLYKINGRTVRARDVQMLFADTVTGANSPSMVSQGAITKIINAKPLERRLILEESAGISGLYARRHEAELRLKGADTNLIRIEDILGSMESRLNQLKRQARQAGRYRNVNAQIRQIEVLIAWLEWQALDTRTKDTQATFSEAESTVASKLAVVTQLTKTLNTQSQDLPRLRQSEAEFAAALQKLRIELERLDDEQQRHQQTLQDLKFQSEQTRSDYTHEQTQIEETSKSLEKLDQEQKALIEVEGEEDSALEEKEALKDEREQKAAALEERFTALMQSTAETKARQQALEQQIKQNEERAERITERKNTAEQQLKATIFDGEKQRQLDELTDDVLDLERRLTGQDQEEATLKSTIQNAKENVEDARESLQTTRAENERFQAELQMLEKIFAGDTDKEYTPVLDRIETQKGFEKALSRALGDTLMASLEGEASSRWLTFNRTKSLPALPNGLEPLGPHVDAPKELHAALSQIGFIENDDTFSNALLEDLGPGQSIVSASGSYWRWDGFHVSADAQDRNAQHLEQKNKLQELKKREPSITKNINAAEEKLQKALTQQQQAEERFEDYQQDLHAQNQILSDKRQALADIREAFMRHETDVTHLKETIHMAMEDLGTLQDVIKWDKERLENANEQTNGASEDDMESLREELTQARRAYQEALREFDAYGQEQRTRKARLQALADERIALQNRLIRSKERHKHLGERADTLKEKLETLSAEPTNSEDLRQTLLEKISQAETVRNKAAEELAICEGAIAETNKALKEAESILSSAREKRAHAMATMELIKEQQGTMAVSIQNKFEMAPQDLKQHITIDLDGADEKLDDYKRQREELVRERESIGAVNLRAEQEAEELEVEVTTLLNERNDLTQAIAELREGIATINAEARERLNVAFGHVNAHFESLFKRLFAGGDAHLALIDSDDPLEAGLEIFAQPPGKALQSLSLLSGGEQTMASIALIIAMFLTNPSPICVLDEIDAPLDDANVDRVCDLLEEIAERGETRFLMITHHRLTMARMDRLYGVTMAEKGISQLVSVDLQQTFEFMDEAA